VKIRAFKAGDAEAVSTLIRDTMRISNSADYPLERLQPLINYFSPDKVLLLSRERHCLVAEVDGRVVGTIALEGAELCTFFVHPDSQGMGIGSELLTAVEKVARAEGLETIHLDASLTGVDFYTRRGYHKTGMEIEGTAGRQVGMEKRLAR
jgi:N-acetylglutamate synthase-like GNAT family acetyltransferase